MNRIKMKMFGAMKDRRHDIENRLLQFYIYCQLVWLLFIALACVVLRLPDGTRNLYLGVFTVLLVFLGIGRLLKLEMMFTNLYFILVLLINPVMWYFSGGPRTSASIFFVSELVLFVMCTKGKKQNIYILLNLLSSGLVQGFVRRVPNPIYPMSEEQYQKCTTLIGITTSLLIVALLIKQKQEYARERDAAVASEKDLERSNMLQKNFLANMSHEIRSPLGIVMGFNNLISKSDDVSQIHEYSKDIKHAGNTLLTVINDILDYSKIESGKLDIIEVDYSLESLVESIKKDITLKCEEKGLKFVVRVDENIPPYMFGDNIRIKQCLINLLSNAVKYTDTGMVVFKIKLKEVKDKDCIIEFEVTDTGKGISEAAMPNLFTAFQRLDEGLNRGIEGTGLGLAITKNLLDEMNGTIEVDSKLGKGSTFVIILPQKIGNEVKEEILDYSERLDGIRVLAVDDTVLNLVLVDKLLSAEGAVVTTIDNGKECLADVVVNEYDIILLDHMMPDMNGVEVFEQMRKLDGPNKNTPVIMLTANAMAGAMNEYIDMGFDGYLSKPISNKAIKEVVLRFGKKSEC